MFSALHSFWLQVSELDRVYLSYLQNKNRAEGRRSYKAYLTHLGEIYKSCADTEDPTKCVASYTARPKPEPPKPAPLKVCDPYKDPYCLYGLYSPYVAPVAAKAPAPAPAPAAVKGKAPAYMSATPILDPRTGYYYYTPVMQPFLSNEQKAELLRICNAEDVECLQYHLRASFGYRPAGGPLPSYAHLGCDPKSDPGCLAHLMRLAPSGLHLTYPYCDPTTNPYCAYGAALQAAKKDDAQAPASLKAPCNPLFDDKCNPLTAYKMASESPDAQDEPASAAMRAAPRAAPAPAPMRQDPYAMFRDAAAAAMQRRAPAPARAPAHPYRLPAVPPRFQMPSRHYQPLSPPQPEPEEERHPLGPRGKTKEGYDCFIGYDEECFPLKPAQSQEPRSAPHRPMFPFPPEAYEPHVKADGSRNGVVEPDPDCDPEYDANCKLRRYDPEAAAAAAAEQPSAPQEEAHHAYPTREHQEQPEHHDDAAQRRDDAYPEQHPEVPGYNPDQYDPYQSGQEDPYAGYGSQDHSSPNFQDMLRGYGDHFGQDDHRAYTGDYKK